MFDEDAHVPCDGEAIQREAKYNLPRDRHVRSADAARARVQFLRGDCDKRDDFERPSEVLGKPLLPLLKYHAHADDPDVEAKVGLRTRHVSLS